MASMNSESKYDQLVWRVAYVMASARSILNNDKRGVASLAVTNQTAISNALSWNAEDWMLASAKLEWVNWIAQALERIALEADELGYIELAASQKDDGSVEAMLLANEEWFDARATVLISDIAAAALRDVLRGIETSSNPMTILASKAKNDAARDVLDTICELSAGRLCSDKVVADIFNGIEERKVQLRREEAQLVRKIAYYKGPAGEYYAQPLNSAGNAVVVPLNLRVTRKADALTEIAKMIQAHRDAGQMHHIAVEAA